MLRIVDSGSRIAPCAGRDARARLRPGAACGANPRGTAEEPLPAEPAILQEGMAAFRANCAYCHGMDGRGARGPDLTGIYSGHTEESLYPLVRAGVPGTEMPPASVFLQEPDTWKVLMYLRTLGVPPAPAPHGNAENGERIFRARCSSCHQVERPRRRPRPRPVAHRHRPNARRAHASNPRRRRGLPIGLRAGDGDHRRGPHGSRHTQGRGSLLGAGHGQH